MLWKIIESEGLSFRDVARRLGAGYTIPHWLYGDRVPGLAAILKIQDEFGIPASAWLQKPTRPFVFPASRPPRTGTEG